MAERDDAPLADDAQPGVPPNDTPQDPTAPAPSGLPGDVEEAEPMGPTEAEPEGDGDVQRGPEAQPGINTGEPDVSG
jgi:hypothetical protein